MEPAEIVRQVREVSQLSGRALSEAAGVAASTVHRIERGEMSPTLGMLRRLAAAGGLDLRVSLQRDHRVSLVGLALRIASEVESDGSEPLVEIVATLCRDFAATFDGAPREVRSRMLTARPPSTGVGPFDVRLVDLAKTLAERGGIAMPSWVR